MPFNSKEKYHIYDTEKNSMFSSLMKITKKKKHINLSNIVQTLDDCSCERVTFRHAKYFGLNI